MAQSRSAVFKNLNIARDKPKETIKQVIITICVSQAGSGEPAILNRLITTNIINIHNDIPNINSIAVFIYLNF
jgi:hypothetical protein